VKTRENQQQKLSLLHSCPFGSSHPLSGRLLDPRRSVAWKSQTDAE